MCNEASALKNAIAVQFLGERNVTGAQCESNLVFQPGMETDRSAARQNRQQKNCASGRGRATFSQRDT
jgi:hypothetical protein